MIQLKSLIKEEVLNENMVSVLKPPVRKAKSTIYGYINLQFHAVPLIKSMREFLNLVNKIDYVGIDFDDREDIKPIYDLGHWKPPFIREPTFIMSGDIVPRLLLGMHYITRPNIHLRNCNKL